MVIFHENNIFELAIDITDMSHQQILQDMLTQISQKALGPNLTWDAAKFASQYVIPSQAAYRTARHQVELIAQLLHCPGNPTQWNDSLGWLIPGRWKTAKEYEDCFNTEVSNGTGFPLLTAICYALVTTGTAF
jgi:hypothetical protein